MGSNERGVGPATAALAQAIRETQGARSMSAAELSRASGIPYSTLRKIRTGDQPIDFEELRKLAIALGVSMSKLAARGEDILGADPKSSDTNRSDGFAERGSSTSVHKAPPSL